jgi:GT2 family glycosyltransferase
LQPLIPTSEPFVAKQMSEQLPDTAAQFARRQSAFVSIVIPHFNAPQLAACLFSILEHGAEYVFELIVVADGSSEEDILRIQNQSPEIRVVVQPRTQGFARTCNAGARAASGKYLVLLNDDTTVTPGWLDRLVAFLEKDPNIGIVGPKLLYPETNLIQHCGTVINEKRHGWHIYRHVPSGFPPANRPRYYRAITGACMMLERDFFLALGGFDIRYHKNGGCEDTDLCFKVLERGRKVAYCPSSVVYHHEAVTRGMRDESHPEEVYNRRLLRQRWEKYLTSDIGDYEVLAEIEAEEGKCWHWLYDVPTNLVAKKCARLYVEYAQLISEHDAAASADDRAARECPDLAAELDRMTAKLNAADTRREALEIAHYQLIRERDSIAAECSALARQLSAIAAEYCALAQRRDPMAARCDARRLGARLRWLRLALLHYVTLISKARTAVSIILRASRGK